MTRFVDTGGWASWVNPRDVHHDQAKTAFANVWATGDRLITTNLVLIELTALLIRMRIDKLRQIDLFDDLRIDPSVEIVTVDPEIEGRAWSLWRSRQDKDWSLVDCTSFVVMAAHSVTEAITADHHYEQSGYVVLLKRDVTH